MKCGENSETSKSNFEPENLSMKSNEKSKLALESDEIRRSSVLTNSDAGSEFDNRKKIKYGGPLAGSWNNRDHRERYS